MKEFPEIEALHSMFAQHKIVLEKSEKARIERSDLVTVLLTLNTHTYLLIVDDEYDDFSVNSAALQLCLVLRALEEYEESTDFMNWCKILRLDASSEELRQYYIGLGPIYNEIETTLGTIDSKISDLDFELNAGAAQVLRGI